MITTSYSVARHQCWINIRYIKWAKKLTFIAILWHRNTGISSSSSSASDDALIVLSLYLFNEQHGLPLKLASERYLSATISLISSSPRILLLEHKSFLKFCNIMNGAKYSIPVLEISSTIRVLLMAAIEVESNWSEILSGKLWFAIWSSSSLPHLSKPEHKRILLSSK